MKSNFQIKLSDEKERQAQADYEKYLQEKMIPLWQECSSSLEEIAEDKLFERERFRLLAYHEACLSRIYNILKKHYGEEFARSVSKIDKFGTLEAAAEVTQLVIKLEQMLSQGAAKAAVQEQLNLFSSEYKLKALEAAEQQQKIAQAKAEEAIKRCKVAEAKAAEGDRRYQAAQQKIALYRKQLEELQALKAKEQQDFITAKPINFALDNAQGQSNTNDFENKLSSLNTAYTHLQDNGVGSTGDRKNPRTTPS